MTAMETITEGEGWSGHWPFQARVLIMVKKKKKTVGIWLGYNGKRNQQFPVQAFSLVSTEWILTRCSGLLPLLWCSHICR